MQEDPGRRQKTWNWLRTHDHAPVLLDVAETAGIHGARRFMDGLAARYGEED
ncbi:MAG: hypothetical protein QOE59_3262, partial [Actinomycetota bacterium]|nr:hypothetical protein [Actinomycetota bacterium]